MVSRPKEFIENFLKMAMAMPVRPYRAGDFSPRKATSYKVKEQKYAPQNPPSHETNPATVGGQKEIPPPPVF